MWSRLGALATLIVVGTLSRAPCHDLAEPCRVLARAKAYLCCAITTPSLAAVARPGVPLSGSLSAVSRRPRAGPAEDGDDGGSGRRTARRGPARDGHVGAIAERRRVPAIALHADNGWLLRVHASVYQLGVFAGPFGIEQAALLACGPRAVLSHWTAIGRLRVACSRRRPDRRLVRRRPRREPCRHPAASSDHPPSLRRCDSLRPQGHDTGPHAARSRRLDAASGAGRLTEEAQVQRLASPAEILVVIERGARRPGVRKLRRCSTSSMSRC